MSGLKITEINLVDEFFTLTNEGEQEIELDGWKVHDQKVEEGSGKRNVFVFEKQAQGLKLAPGAALSVYSGPSSSTAREYDNVTTVHWFNYAVWDNTGDTAYLTNPSGEKEHTLTVNGEPAEEVAEVAAEEVAEVAAEPAKEEETNGDKVVATEAQKEADALRTEDTELTGTCKWFHYQKGFGFIHEVSDGGSEVFVHNSAITPYEGQQPILTVGLKVKFKFTIDKDGRSRAQAITMPDGSPVRTHSTRKNNKLTVRLDEDKDIRLGWCKWFDSSKGYGFISQENPEDPDVFMHQGSVTFAGPASVTQGQDLEFKVTTETKEDGTESVRAADVTSPGGHPVKPMQAPMQGMQVRQLGAPMGIMGGRGNSVTLLGKRPAEGALLHRGIGQPMGRQGQGPGGMGLLNHGGMQRLNMQPQMGQMGGMAMNGMGMQSRGQQGNGMQISRHNNPYTKYL